MYFVSVSGLFNEGLGFRVERRFQDERADWTMLGHLTEFGGKLQLGKIRCKSAERLNEENRGLSVVPSHSSMHEPICFAKCLGMANRILHPKPLTLQPQNPKQQPTSRGL